MYQLSPKAENNFYPRSPCGERQRVNQFSTKAKDISIHALLAESDKRIRHRRLKPRHFYPRSPCGERLTSNFQRSKPAEYFYPRSPCGERPRERTSIKPIFGISIHALLAESDCRKGSRRCVLSGISIHALLAESDFKMPVPARIYSNFYPRSPCGERR